MTGALTSIELARLLDFSAELQAVEHLADLPRALLPALLRLVDADVSGWNDIDTQASSFQGYLYPDESSAAAFADLSDLEEQPPLLRHFQQHPSSGPTRISDVCSSRQWHQTAAYTEVYRRYGIESQIGFPVTTTATRIGAVVLNRATGDFTDAAILVLAAARRHIEIAHRRLLRDAARTAARAALGPDAGWLVTDATGIVIDFDGTAAVLFDDSGLALEPGRTLPRPPGAVSIAEIDCRLAPGAGTGRRYYAVRPTVSPQSIGLTRRQYQVLCCVADGATVDSAARALGISSYTLATHLRDAYAALGVAGRLAALNTLRAHGLAPQPVVR